MTRLQGILMVALLLPGTSAAFADDDFIAQCKLGEDHDADRICGCIAQKIAVADRPNALAAMRRINELVAAGKQVDPTSLTPDMRQGMQKLIETEGQCTP
ncbi:MAG TPA: hypothetical protein VLX85_05370 [Stellaceae bacterium]|nr:hypothetical protein [Stellaceae bacterium]